MKDFHILNAKWYFFAYIFIASLKTGVVLYKED